jgi:hypothetical protein
LFEFSTSSPDTSASVDEALETVWTQRYVSVGSGVRIFRLYVRENGAESFAFRVAIQNLKD